MPRDHKMSAEAHRQRSLAKPLTRAVTVGIMTHLSRSGISLTSGYLANGDPCIRSLSRTVGGRIYGWDCRLYTTVSNWAWDEKARLNVVHEPVHRSDFDGDDERSTQRVIAHYYSYSGKPVSEPFTNVFAWVERMLERTIQDSERAGVSTKESSPTNHLKLLGLRVPDLKWLDHSTVGFQHGRIQVTVGRKVLESGDSNSMTLDGLHPDEMHALVNFIRALPTN